MKQSDALHPPAPGAEELSPVKRALLEIRDLRARLAEAQRGRSEPIAIVGIGLRFPGGASDPATYWDLLAGGVDAIREVPAERWPADRFYDPDPDTPGRMVTRWGGFLDDVDRFDHAFFGISPREAESLDPQQRLLLEVSWEALEHAGIPADRLFGTSAGIFLGIANSDYMRMLLADRDQIDTYTTTGNALSIAAGRLAYLLGVQGPALSVDTACSSSLVAVHLAAQALRSRECDLALAGGVNLILTPELTINFSRARMMAPDGRCKTFDAAADGYVRSEGCGMVVLERLGDALAAGHRVLAVVRGSAVNQDGRSGGLTAPSGPAQEQVVRRALAAAGLEPGDVGYVEAHGTGTLLGDPIEVGALGASLCADRPRDRPLLLGSVKTNIGHTESAAGVAGLIKVVLMLQHGVIPPHLHLTELNPHIAAAGLPIEVPTAATPWPAGPRVAGVSSFGLSGTNADVVVGEPPAPESVPAQSTGESLPVAPSRPSTVTLSARSDAALVELAAAHAALLERDGAPSLAEVAWATQTGRSHLPRRVAVAARESGAAAAQLRAFAAHALAPDAPDAAGSSFVDTSVASGTAERGIAFLFTGHGSHHAGAGAELYATEPVFAAAVDRCADVLADELDVPLADVLFGDEAVLPAARRATMALAQPALFSLQHALTELWGSWGVRPTFVAGHSAGEYVAAVLAGVLSLEDGLRLIAARGRLMDTMEAGEMVALFADEATVGAAVARHADDVGIAAVNGPTTTVVSGRAAAVAAVIGELGLGDDEVRRLDVSIAAHSPLVAPIVPAFAEVVSAVRLSRPALGLVSSMTGRFADDELTDAGYWRAHLRCSVRFADVFETLREAGCSTFVEIGPQPTLLGLGRRNWTTGGVTWVPSLRRGVRDADQLAMSVATLYAGGADLDWTALGDATRRGPLVELPTYPWQRSRHWSPRARLDAGAPVEPRFPAAAGAAAAQAAQGPLDLDLALVPRRFAALDDLAVRAIAAALRELGLFAVAGERRTAAELVTADVFQPGFAHLAARWLAHLADAGLLVRDGDVFVAPAPLPADDVVVLADALRPEFAGVEPLLDYVARSGRHAGAVVSGAETALSLLFPDGSYATVDFIYGGWAVPRYFNAIVRAAVAAVATARAGRELRVLEVGAGTGGTTAAVLPALPATRTHYTFTDVSEFFLTRAAERFAAFPFVRYSLLDVEQPPAEQGFAPGAYDVVVAANVLHATADLDVTLAHVRSLLAPGGVLVAYEGTAHPSWFDVTTGLLEGWQRFADGWRTDVPLIRPEVWAQALTAAGFDEVRAFPRDDAPTAQLLHHVFVARAAGDEAAVSAAEQEPGVGASVAPLGAPPLVDDIRAMLADALPDERHDVLVDVVRLATAAVLRVADPSRLARDQPLLDLGFDSLMAVELRNVLREGLGLPDKLPATLVFDHPTIAAIATFLLGRLDAGSTAEPGDPVPAPAPLTPASLLGEADLAGLSDDEVEAMLLRRLTEIER